MAQVISTQSSSKRIFKNDFLELFTRVHWSVPLILYLPLIGYFIYQSTLNPKFGFFEGLGIFIIGYFIWVFFEYFLHRFIFHLEFKNEKLKKMYYLVHDFHHEYPNDALRLVMPPIESIPIAVILILVFTSFLPLWFFYPMAAGFGLGYLSYDMIHYSVHHLPMNSRLGQYLKKNHYRHHFHSGDYGYGVSSPWVDRIFKTKDPRAQT